MKIQTNSLEETYQQAFSYIKNLQKEPNKAIIIGLVGDLGSGKTSFVQGVTKYFGLNQYITSPTFVIQKIYNLPNGFNWSKLIHIDAYRLDNNGEFLRLNELIKDSNNLIFIEWPDRIKQFLPDNFNKIYFKFLDENSREIIYER